MAAALQLGTGQARHAVALVALLAAALTAALAAGLDRAAPAVPLWFAASLAVPIAHQLWVWWCWRRELLGGHLSARWGGPERAFRIYAAVFAVLGLGRIVAVAGLAAVDAGTLDGPAPLHWTLATATAVPSLYLGYSVARYFGFHRALGSDHFDPAYRHAPLVRQGIFRWTNNGMYAYGFLLLWSIALATGSTQALIAAAFQHAYIWVHFWTTEKPDMTHIYGPPPTPREG